MSENKKVRKSYTMAFKANCIVESDRSNNVSKTAAENKISRRQLQKWRAKRDSILSLARKGKTKRSRLVTSGSSATLAKFPELEADLTNWLKEQVSKK